MLDLLSYLKAQNKKIVLYGMGDGAEKVIQWLDSAGLTVDDFFASDDHVRGQLFHGKTVIRFQDVIDKYNQKEFVILIAFGCYDEDVISHIIELSQSYETYIPDVPVFRSVPFSSEKYTQDIKKIKAVRDLLSDESSLTCYDALMRYKLSGRIEDLTASFVNDEVATLHLEEIESFVDCGAYNGDTIVEMMTKSSKLKHVIAFEPDAYNYNKLIENSKAWENKFNFCLFNAALWDKNEENIIHTPGNRNASVIEQNIVSHNKKVKTVQCVCLDDLVNDTVDYIKYDVEGAEKEALLGSADTINAFKPVLKVSLYHRACDLYELPLLIHELFPFYRHYYMRKKPSIPGWDIDLYVTI